MIRHLFGTVALGAICAALPAAAQTWSHGHYDRGQPYGYMAPYSQGSPRAGQLLQLIEDLLEDDVIEVADARFFRAQVAAVSRLEWRYSRDGLNSWERRDLRVRYAELEDRIHDATEQDGDWDDRE